MNPATNRPDPVARLALALAGLAAVIGTTLLVARESVRDGLVVPIVARLGTDDGQVDADSLLVLDGLLQQLALAGLAAALGLLLWRALWRWLPTRAVGAAATREAVPACTPVPRSVLFFAAAVTTLLVSLAWQRSFGYDEICTAMHFVRTDSFWETASTYKLFNNHVAFSLLGRASVSCLGETEWTLRLPALLLGLTALLATARLGAALVGRTAASLGVVLLAVSPSLVTWAASARGYSGLMALGTFALQRYLVLLSGGGARDAWILAGCLAFGAWFHLYALLLLAVLVVHLLALLVFAPARLVHLDGPGVRRTWLALTGGALGALLLHAPVLPKLLLNVTQRRPGLFRPELPAEWMTELTGASAWPVGLAVLALAALGLRALARRSAPAGLLLGLLTGPVLLLWLVLQPYDLYGRFFAFTLPVFTLLVAAGVMSLARQRVGRAIAATLAIALVGHGLMAAQTVDEEGFRAAVLALEGRSSQHTAPAPGTARLALGGGCELFDYYATTPLQLLDDEQDFARMLAEHDAIRAVHRPTPWEHAHHRAAADWLAEHGRRELFGNVELLTWP